MTLRSWISRTFLWFLDFFLRDRNPRSVALGVAIGIGLGFFPLSTLQWGICAFAALFLPIPLLITLAIALPLSLLTPLADSVFDALGKMLLNISWLRGVFTFFYHLPIIPYTRFNNTVMLGSSLIGGTLAVAGGIATFWCLKTYWTNLGFRFRASPFLSSLDRTAFGTRYLKAVTESRWVRWQSLGLLFLVLLVAVPVLVNVFPPWLHRRVESELAALHGAPVHIDLVQLNPWAPSLDIRGLSLMRSDGKHTLILLRRLHVQFAWKPLFSRKILITDFTPEGLHLGAPGESKPEAEYDAKDFVEDRNSLPNLLAGNLHRKLRTEYGVNPLHAVGDLGTSMELSRKVLPLIPRLELTKDIQKNSGPLEKEVVHWEERGETIQSRFLIGELEQEWATAKATPALRHAFFEKTQLALKDLKAVEEEFKADVERQQATVQAMRDAIPAAISSLKNELRLPQLDGKDISAPVFGPHAIHFLERLTHWVDRSRKFMPTGGARQVEQARNRGYSVHFGGPGQPPLFLLTRAELNSGEPTKDQPGKELGQVKGYVANVTSDPYILGRPMETELSFDFPSEEWKGGTASARIDHTGDIPKEKLRVTLTDFSLANWEISRNQPVSITAKSGRANLVVDLSFEDDKVTAEGSLEVKDFVPDIYTLDREIRSELQAVMEQHKSFTLKGSLTGTLEEPKVQLESEWGVHLQDALRTAYQTPLAALDDAIRQVLLDEIDPALKKQETQISQASRQIFQRIGIIAHSLSDLRDKAVLPERSLSSRKKKK